MSYRYSYDPYYDYYDPYYYGTRRTTPGYYTTRDGRWPASYHSYMNPTKSSAARRGVWDNRGWYSDSDYYWRRPTTTTRTSRPGHYANANVWDVMNHHRDYYRTTSPAKSGVYYDYHGRAHQRLDGKLPPLRY